MQDRPHTVYVDAKTGVKSSLTGAALVKAYKAREIVTQDVFDYKQPVMATTGLPATLTGPELKEAIIMGKVIQGKEFKERLKSYWNFVNFDTGKPTKLRGEALQQAVARGEVIHSLYYKPTAPGKIYFNRSVKKKKSFPKWASELLQVDENVETNVTPVQVTGPSASSSSSANNERKDDVIEETPQRANKKHKSVAQEAVSALTDEDHSLNVNTTNSTAKIQSFLNIPASSSQAPRQSTDYSVADDDNNSLLNAVEDYFNSNPVKAYPAQVPGAPIPPKDTQPVDEINTIPSNDVLNFL